MADLLKIIYNDDVTSITYIRDPATGLFKYNVDWSNKDHPKSVYLLA